MLALAQQLS